MHILQNLSTSSCEEATAQGSQAAWEWPCFGAWAAAPVRLCSEGCWGCPGSGWKQLADWSAPYTSAQQGLMIVAFLTRCKETLYATILPRGGPCNLGKMVHIQSQERGEQTTSFCHLSPPPPVCDAEALSVPQAPGFFVRTIKVICQMLSDFLSILVLGKSEHFWVRLVLFLWRSEQIWKPGSLESRYSQAGAPRVAFQGDVWLSWPCTGLFTSSSTQILQLQIQTPHWEFYLAAISTDRATKRCS